MTSSVKLDLEQLRAAVQEEYAEVAACPTKGYHFHVGRAHAERLGYGPTDLARRRARISPLTSARSSVIQ